MLSNILEHHGRANQHLASLEEDLVHAKIEEEKLKATIETLEKEKSKMNARVALMERKDLYELLEAKIEGFHIANHPRMIEGFENLNLTITRKWVEIPALNLEEFEKCLANYPENLGAKPQRLTRSTRVRLDYEPTILPDVPPTDNPAHPVTLDLTVDAREHPSSPPQSQIVLVPAFVDLTQYMSSPENEGSEDQGWPQAIFHVLRIVLCLSMPTDPVLVQTGIMNVEQQQDGHSCGNHMLQMLVGAGKKESEGLDRCFREEGLRYIATLEQVQSFDVLFPMYLSGKLPGPPI
ncbi:hypothetical protein R1flu_007772 [Riccia fluitans]|uniref:Ubiquitin-like protease family profile domain-containing protein n=1 Tax=Riccia fluitans TaxID=41844 RepID=A0ABD1Z0M6_9MARC